MKTPLLFYAILILCSIIFFNSSAQQTAIIKGTVKTSDGRPAAAVSVGLNGIPKGTITDEFGYYQLS